MTMLLPAFTSAPEPGRVYHTDLFTLCDAMPSASVDMVLMDLPYGTTACSWDTVIPFEPMWARLKRIIKPRGAIVLTASQPFTSALVMSNPGWFRYVWTWNKKYHSNPFLSGTQPLRVTEDVLVFSSEQGAYFPQVRKRPDEWLRMKPSFAHKNGAIFGKSATDHPNSGGRDWMFPINLLDFPLDNPNTRETTHPTQKPVALFEYLIRTYTREGELVFDGVVGSGTTAVAARNCKRNFICGDKELDYVLTARDRLRMPFEARQKPVINDVSDLPLFASATS